MTISCEIVNKISQLEAIRSEWQLLAEKAEDLDFYLSWDWYYSVVHFSRSLPGELRIFVVRRENEVLAIIPCQLVRKKLRFTSVRSLEFLGSIYSPRRGALVQFGLHKEVANWFLQSLLTTHRNEWDLLGFIDLSPQDKFIAALIKGTQDAGIWLRQDNLFVNMVTDWSDFRSSEEFHSVLSKKMRRNIQQGINSLNRNGDFDIWLLQNYEQDVDLAISHYYQIYKKSWKETEADPEFHGKFIKYLASAKKVRLFLLYYKPFLHPLGDASSNKTCFSSYRDQITTTRSSPPVGLEPMASLLVIKHQNRSYALKTAYPTQYDNLSPGTVLYWFALKHLIDESCIFLDFQKGDDPYKFRWNGKISETRFRLRIVNPRALLTSMELRVTSFMQKIRALHKKKETPNRSEDSSDEP